jgi:hypothetical protein
MFFKVVGILGLHYRIYSVKKYWEVLYKDKDKLFYMNLVGLVLVCLVLV